MSTATSTASQASELYEQAIETFEKAVKTGIKIQEDSAKWLSSVMDDMRSPRNWQKRTQVAMDKVMPVATQNFEEALKLLNQNTRTSVELARKALEAGQGEALGDIQGKVREMWETVLEAVRANAQAAVQTNARILQTLEEIGQKGKAEAAAQA